jgi:N-acetyl sugar amidotransferase
LQWHGTEDPLIHVIDLIPSLSSQECTQCLYRASHPFGLQFSTDGLCTGCLTHREKSDLDWNQRFHLLENLVHETLRKRRSGSYDCVLPIRGTPEYFYVLDVVRNRLKLNPLVVSYNSHFNSQVGIQNIDLMRETFDVDILIYASNAEIYRKLVRESLVRFANIRLPFLAGETVFPVQVAVERDIPLVFWPYHQATEQVGMHSYTEAPEMSRRYRAEFDLIGIEPEDLTSSETLVNASDVWDLKYPSDQALMRTSVRGLYLANYLPWDTRCFSEEMIYRYGAFAASNYRTFDTYDRIDDVTYMSIHDVLKHFKLGYSRVTDSLCREIRFGRICREDACVIERYYQSIYPVQSISAFLHWLGMDDRAFEWLTQRLPFASSLPIQPSLSAQQQAFIDGFLTNAPSVEEGKGFILFGKGLSLTDSM